MATIMQEKPQSNHDRHQRWTRFEGADLFARSGALHTQGVSQRHAAQVLAVPRSTLQAWRAYQDRLDSCPEVVACFHRVAGLAFLHRLVLAWPMVWVEIGACGIRLVCLRLELTGLHRFVGASYGTQQQVHRRVEEAHVMPPQAITLTQEETFTGGLCLVGSEPVSNARLLEQAAQARDHDTGHALMAQALEGLNCWVRQATSAEAPGLLASVAQPLGAPHAPDLCQVPHALSKAVAAPLAVKQRAAAKAVAQDDETRNRVPERLAHPNGGPGKRGPGRPPKAAVRLAQVGQTVAAARDEHQRRTAPREQVPQGLRALGHAYHLVALARGVRRNGTGMAGAIQQPIDTMRTMAPQAGLSETCLDRMAKAERVGPKLQATIEVVSG